MKGVAGNGFLGITLRLKLNNTICAFLLLARLIFVLNCRD